eukprot:7886215-Alexandrium_andersonii.AAC.1
MKAKVPMKTAMKLKVPVKTAMKAKVPMKMATKAKVPMKGNSSATKDHTDMLHLPCKIVVRKASA